MAEFRESLRKLDNLNAKLGSSVTSAQSGVPSVVGSFTSLCQILQGRINELSAKMEDFQRAPTRATDQKYLGRNNRISLSIQCKKLMRDIDCGYRNLSIAYDESSSNDELFQEITSSFHEVKQSFSWLFHKEVTEVQSKNHFSTPLLNEFPRGDQISALRENEYEGTDFTLYFQQAHNTHAKMDESLDKIMSGCSRLKESALHIHDELSTQESMLNDINKKEDNIHGEMSVLNKRLQKVLFDLSSEKLFLYLIFFFVLLMIVGYILYEVGAVRT